MSKVYAGVIMMRKRLVGIVLLAICLAFSCRTARAQTSIAIGLSIVQANPPPNIVVDSGTLNGWSFTVVGASNSPNLQPIYALDAFTIDATCISGGCAPLTVDISDQGYTQYSGLTTNYNVLVESGAGGSSSERAVDGDTFFDFPFLIGTVGPFTGVGSGSAFGPASSVLPPYSLTIEEVFDSGPGPTSFQANADIVATTPEPGTLLLFGSGLLGFGVMLRRRLTWRAQ